MLRPLALRNGVRLCVLLALFVLACSCGGHVNAAELARLVLREQLPEEDSIERVCARASGMPDGQGKEALGRARDHAQHQARDVLCHALECGQGKACECASDGIQIRFHTQIELTAAQKNVLASLGARRGLSFDGAWQEAEQALGGQAAAPMLDRLNLSRAGLVVLLRFADEAQSMADSIAASFGWLQGFAQPLLRRVVAETVAAAMDAAVDEMKAHVALPHADLTRQACGFYAKRDPRASVGDRLLRRLILRFAPDDVRERIGKGKQRECDRLDAAADLADRGVCKKIRQELSLDAQSVPMLKQPAPEEKAAEIRAKAQGQSFARMATSCFAANPGEPLACSADRVTSAASYIYLLSVYEPLGAGAELLQSVPFSQIEERLLAMENEIALLRGEVREIGAARDWHERVDEDLVRLLHQQAAQIQKLEEGTAFFARLASERCRKEYDEARRKRSQLAKELGFGDRFCSDERSGEVRSGPENASVSVDPVAFCRPNSPIRLKLQWDFTGCDFALGAEQKKVLEKLGSIAGKERFIVNGYASSRAPSNTCFKVAERAGLPASDEPRSMAKYGVTSPDPSPVHAGLSFLRALVVAEAMASGMARTANRAEIEQLVRTRFELKPWGASQASRDCEKEADPNKQNECFKLDQRVELEARLDEYMFRIEGCP